MQLVRRLAHVEIMDGFDRCVYCLEMNGNHARECLHGMAVELVARVNLDTHSKEQK